MLGSISTQKRGGRFGLDIIDDRCDMETTDWQFCIKRLAFVEIVGFLTEEADSKVVFVALINQNPRVYLGELVLEVIMDSSHRFNIGSLSVGFEN